MLRFLFIIFLFPLSCIAGDSTATKNFFLLKVNYPVPSSGVTFQRIYNGVINTSGGFEHIVRKRFSLGIFCDYSSFKTDRNVLDVKTNMNIISGSVGLGTQIQVFKKICIHSLLSGGYAFISFKGIDADGNSKPTVKEQGPFMQPSLLFHYYINKTISVGLNWSYKIIYKHFGNKATYEDKNIIIADFGIGATYNF